MKKITLKYYNNIALALLALSFMINSCRSVGSDNPENITDPPVNTGDASVVVNLLGSEFVESDGNSPQASTVKQLRNPQPIQYTLIDPCTLLAAEVSEDTSVPLKTSAGINPVAAVPGGSLANGAKFRLIAYRMDGSYADYKDFTVDGPPSTTGGLRLPKDVPYWMVVYSYGTNNLPGISFNETQSLGNARHTYNNMAGQNGFLYQIQMFRPVEGDNYMDVILMHKIAQVTTKINSSALSAPNNITSVSSAILKGNNRNVEFSLLDASVQSRSTLQDVMTTFVGQSPSTEWTSNAVFINADSPVNKTISFSANVAVNSGTAKPITVTNGFTIKPGYRTTYKINLKETKCGAMVLGIFREFECYNRGATKNGNPFVPVAEIHGSKYQWGGKELSQAMDQTYGNELTSNIAQFSTSNINTMGLPCDDGYRIPNTREWQSLIGSNDFSAIGSQSGSPGINNYMAGIQVKEKGVPNPKVTLMFPLAGWRGINRNSSPVFMPIQGRGNNSLYWSSSSNNSDGSTNNSDGAVFQHNPGNAGTQFPIVNAYIAPANPRISGVSVRCIKKLPTDP